MDFVEYVKPLITWLHLHPGSASFIIFVISFLESIAIIGLFIPGSVVMSAIGTLVGAGIIPVYETLLCASLGAIIGDTLSYMLGEHYTERVREVWPFKRYPQMIKSAEEFFAHHGGKSVFLGRFVGPMRPIIPIVAGMTGMKKLRFYVSCIIAGILWSPAYMLPGILIGAASQQLAPQTATRFVVTVLCLLLIIWLSAWFFKWLLYKFFRWLHYKIEKLWQYLERYPAYQKYCDFLRNPADPNCHNQLFLALAALFFILVFALFLISLMHGGIVTYLNQPIHQLCMNFQTIPATKFMVLVSFLGYKYVIGVMGFCVLLWLIWKKYYRAAIHWIVAASLGGVIVSLTKLLVYSPRPDAMMYLLDGNSFPSGHATLSVILYLLLAFFIARNFSRPSQKKYIYGFFTTLCFLIILSRIYLGVHWLTDVLAACFIGIIIVLLTILSFNRAISRKIKLPGFLSIIIVSIAVSFGFQVTHNYQELIQIYTPYWPSYSANLTDWWQQNNNIPPLYRPNRVGNPVEIMNIQWVDNLQHIEQHLTAKGWHTTPKLTMIGLINRVSSSDKEQHLPLLPSLYLGQRPRYIAVKRSSQNQVMILQLWASNIDFTDSNLPLWVGTVTYQKLHKNEFWHNGGKPTPALTSPLDELKPALAHYQWRVIFYPSQTKPVHVKDYQWNSGVILIKPRKM